MFEVTDSEARHEPRTNMFVMATISGPTAIGPVKVRNLSSAGALIEGTALPVAREKVHLRRGRLAVTGEVVWCGSGQAGLRFFAPVNVKEWLPTSANRAGQQRLDEILQQCRADTGPTSPKLVFETAAPDPISSYELTRVARGLEALADELADDPTVVGRHSSAIQMLDVAAQVLRKLAVVSP